MGDQLEGSGGGLAALQVNPTRKRLKVFLNIE
jgi:hypothetical protein